MADEKKENTDTHLVEECKLNLQSYWRATQSLRSDIRESNDFVVGGIRQWRDDDAKKLVGEQRPVLSFNTCQPVINFLAGYQSEREQDFRAFPRGSEDEQLGRLATGQLKYAMDVANGSREMHTLFRRGTIGGLSVIEVGHSFEFTDDLLEGDASLVVLPDNAWACDPGARRYDRNDAAWQCKLMWMGLKDAKARWPGKQFTNLSASIGDATGADARTTGVPDHLLAEFFSKDTQQVRIMQYWYQVPVKAVMLVDMARPGGSGIFRMKNEKEAEAAMKAIHDQAGAAIAQRFRIMPTDTATVLENVETGEQVPVASEEEAEKRLDFMKKQAGTGATASYQIHKRELKALRTCHLTAWDLLDDGPSPYLEDWRYPFVPFIAYQDSDDYNSIKGIIQDIKDAQREINWQHSTLLDVVARGPKGQTWIPKAEGSDIQKLKQEIHKAGFIGEFAAQVPPVYIPPAAWDQGAMNLLTFSVEAIMRITGINAELMGQTTQKTVSGRAIQSRQAGGLVGVHSMLLNWTSTKRMVGHLLLKRIQQFYSVEKMMRVAGENQRMAQEMGLLGAVVTPDEMLFEQLKKMKNTDFDVKIDFQESSATARQAVFNQMMQLVATGFPVPPELVLETTDVPYKEEIKAALAKQGMQPPNEGVARVIGASQGSGGGGADGVNLGK